MAVLGVSAEEWIAIGTFVLAAASVLALGGAVAQILTTRSGARRDRAYDYADTFNRPEIIALTARTRAYWKGHGFEHFSKLTPARRAEMLIVPNLIEEMGAAYVRRLIDRDIAAQMVGPLAEDLWKLTADRLVKGAQAERRKERKSAQPGSEKWIYSEWKAMQEDTRSRREASRGKTRRLHSRLERKRWWREPSER